MEIRRIRADEWRELRDLRLRALQDAPDAFGSTYEEESGDTESQWMEWASGAADGGSSFGVIAVDEEACWIGMAIGAPHSDHPGEAGLFAMWVDPAARGSGVARSSKRSSDGRAPLDPRSSGSVSRSRTMRRSGLYLRRLLG